MSTPEKPAAAKKAAPPAAKKAAPPKAAAVAATETAQPNPLTAPADSTVIHEEAAAVMQSVVAAAQTEAPVADLGGTKVLGAQTELETLAEEPKPLPAAYVIEVVPMVTFNMVNPFVHALKEDLTSFAVEVDGAFRYFNFWNPLVTARVKAGDAGQPAPEGIMRAALQGILQQAADYQGRQAVFLGDESQVSETVDAIAAQIRKAAENCIPVHKDFELIELEAGSAAQQDSYTLRFGDLFSLSSWTTREKDETSSLTTFTVWLNLSMVCGALDTSTEPSRFLSRAYSLLKNLLTKAGFDSIVADGGTTPYMSVCLKTVQLSDAATFDMVSDLVHAQDGTAYAVVSLRDVLADREPWLPANAGSAVFKGESDMLLIAPLFEQDSEAAEAAGEVEAD